MANAPLGPQGDEAKLERHGEDVVVTPEIPPLPADATPEQKDLHWYKHVYQGDRMPQLTWRAVIMGGFLGMLMSAANLYTTLSIGWAFGIAITACVLSYVIWNFVRFTSGNKLSQMSVLENACMASTASAAGYSTGSTIATMFGALVLLKDPPEGLQGAAYTEWARNLHTWDVTKPWVVIVFTLCTGLMGVFLAIPMKRQQINHEQLPFPTGTAAAETLRSLYSQSAAAVRKAYVLVIGLAAGLLIGFLRIPDDVLQKVGFLRRFFDLIRFRIPSEIEMHFADKLYGQKLADGTTRYYHPAGFAFEPSALLIAAGMIVGMRTSLSLVVSSAILYLGVGPWLAQSDLTHLQRGATTVMTAASDAGKGKFDAQTAGDSAVEAVVAAATSMGIDPEPVRRAARQAADAAIKEAPKDGDAAQTAQGVADAVGQAAGPGAATALANLPASKAAADARAAALSTGVTPEEAEKAATKAFNENKYKPSFIWNWGGGVVVIHRWSLWGGTALMVFASLMSVALQWKTIARAFTGVRGGGGDAPDGKFREIEVPGSWMIVGMVPITIAMIWLQMQAFGVTWYAGLIAVAMSFVLSMVASRATGETDTTPIGAMGKVMQLMFAALAPGNVNANLASAGIAANSASSSADLLTDLKTGYLLGANPRRQFLAQFFGVFFGTVAIVPIWYMMVPNREKLESFALPATRAWEAVARVLVKGVGELPSSAVNAIFIGAGLGIVLPLIERLASPKMRRFLPSVTGLGLAWVMPFQNAFSFFLGAVVIMVWSKMHKKTADQYNVPVASGLIAGESLMQAALAITATVVGLLASGAN